MLQIPVTIVLTLDKKPTKQDYVIAKNFDLVEYESIEAILADGPQNVDLKKSIEEVRVYPKIPVPFEYLTTDDDWQDQGSFIGGTEAIKTFWEHHVAYVREINRLGLPVAQVELNDFMDAVHALKLPVEQLADYIGPVMNPEKNRSFRETKYTHLYMQLQNCKTDDERFEFTQRMTRYGIFRICYGYIFGNSAAEIPTRKLPLTDAERILQQKTYDVAMQTLTGQIGDIDTVLVMGANAEDKDTPAGAAVHGEVNDIIQMIQKVLLSTGKAANVKNMLLAAMYRAARQDAELRSTITTMSGLLKQLNP